VNATKSPTQNCCRVSQVILDRSIRPKLGRSLPCRSPSNLQVANVLRKPYPHWGRPPDYRCRWRAARLRDQYRICRRQTLAQVTKSFWLRRKSRTSAWRRFMSSTKKAPQHSVPKFSSPEADAAVAGAEAAAAVVAAEAVAGAAAVAAFGSTAAAEAAWCVQDAQWAGGAFRHRLCISIRRRRAGRH
jgi:hypothetical protein